MRVLIVDDHEVVRRGVISLLGSRSDCVIVGEAANGLEGVEKARELRPDIVLMDISMPAMNGLEATRHLRSFLPGCEVLILSQHETPEMASQAFKAGARGYVTKSSISKNLLAALDKVSRHESFFDSGIAESARPIDVQEVLQRSNTLEQALQESEQLYRTTFERAAVGVAHVAADGRWLRVNQKVCEITGYSEAELLKMRFQDISSPDDIATDLAETEKLLNGTLDNFSMEKRYLRKDGSTVWGNLSVSCNRDSRGQFRHFITVIEDISERRDSERTRARLAAIVESSDDAIVSKDLDGTIRSWNSGATNLFGFTAKEAVGRPITIIIPPELVDEERRIIARLRNGECIEHYETIRMHKSGARLNISLTISPLLDSRGHVIGASKIARDISGRKQVEAALDESRAQLALALESSRTAIFDWNIFERRGKWNPQMATLYDFTPACEEITADEWLSLFHPEDTQRLIDEMGEAVGNQEKFEFVYRTAPRPGTAPKWILSHGRVVRDAEGKAVRLIGTHTDITDRKQAEEVARVRELSGKLLHAQDAERRRIARELHDSAGQIIAAVQMNLTPVKIEAEKSKASFAPSIAQSLELIQQLSEELRTVSYLLHPPLLDELGLPSALHWYVDGFVARSKIDVGLELSNDLGRLPDDMEMTLFRIVQECLTNIHRHSGSKRAIISIQREIAEVRLEVRDYGAGMSNGAKRSHSYAGSGVGIQGMRERVRQLNGQFHIHSDRHGTTVTVSFGIIPSVPADHEAAAKV